MAMLYLRNKPIGAISSGASGGGHTIENASGTDMTQRSNLQFTDADVADDSTNDRTEISVVRKLTQAEFDELTPEEQNRGVIVIKDANPIYVPSNNAVSVTADGVKTAGELLLSLYHLIDFSKVTNDATLVFNNANGTIYYLSIGRKDSNKLYFYGVFNADTATEHNLIVTVDGTTALFENCMSKANSPYVSFQDYSSVVLDDGTTIILYYTSITKVIESCDADDVSFDATVKNILPNTATDCQKAIDALSSPNYVILARTDSSVSLSNQNIGKYKFLILATEYGSGILATSVIPTGFFVDYPPLSAHATPQVGNTKNIYAKIDNVSGTLSSCSFTVTVTNPSGDSNFKALLFGVY